MKLYLMKPNKIIWALILYLAAIMVWHLFYNPSKEEDSKFLEELEFLEKSINSLNKKKFKLDSLQRHQETIDSLTTC